MSTLSSFECHYYIMKLILEGAGEGGGLPPANEARPARGAGGPPSARSRGVIRLYTCMYV